MNIKKELKRLEYNQKIKSTFKRIFKVLKYYLCTHNDLEEQLILVNLGNSSTSILEELLGKQEAEKNHKMYIKVIKCSNCGRELYREIVKEEVLDNEKS